MTCDSGFWIPGFRVAQFAAFANFYGPPSLLCVFLVGDCGKIVIFAIFAKYAAFANFYVPLHCFVLCFVVIFAILPNFAALVNFYGPPSLLCVFPCWRLWQNCHFRHICQICRFRQLLWAPFTALCFPRWRLWQNCHFRQFCQIRRFRQLLWAPITALCFLLVGDCGKIVIFAKFAAFANFFGPPSLLCVFLVGDCGKIVIFAIFAKFAAFANFYGPPSLLCVFCSLAIVAKLSFSPYLPNSPLSSTFMGPLHCFVLFLVGDCGKIVIFAIFAKFADFANFYGPPSLLCVFLVGDCGKIVIFAIFAKFTAFANFYGPPSLLCVFCSLAIVAKLSFSPYLPNSPLSSTFMGPHHCFVFFARWRLWQNCHFRHICQICRFRQLLWAPFTALCFPRWRLWQNCHFRHICQIHRFRQLLWAPITALCFLLVGDCGKIVIFAIFAKFAAFVNFYGPPSLLCVVPRCRLWQNCHFRHICQIRRFRQLLWASFTALCVSSLAIVAKLSFLPYLPNSPLSSTFMGPLHCFVCFLVGDCGKIVIFAIFAKFAAFANFYGPPSLLCVLPRWRLWQNCHFRHICQIRRFRQLLWVPFTALCCSSLPIVAKLSFSPYLPNSPTFSHFCHFCCCVHFWTYLKTLHMWTSLVSGHGHLFGVLRV